MGARSWDTTKSSHSDGPANKLKSPGQGQTRRPPPICLLLFSHSFLQRAASGEGWAQQRGHCCLAQGAGRCQALGRPSYGALRLPGPRPQKGPGAPPGVRPRAPGQTHTCPGTVLSPGLSVLLGVSSSLTVRTGTQAGQLKSHAPSPSLGLSGGSCQPRAHTHGNGSPPRLGAGSRHPVG